MTTHFRILSWKISWTEGPGGYSPWDRKEMDITERLHFLSFFSHNIKAFFHLAFDILADLQVSCSFLFIAMFPLPTIIIFLNKVSPLSTSVFVFTWEPIVIIENFPGGASGKEATCQHRRCKNCGLNRWVRKISWRRAWQPTSVFMPGESHGQRSMWTNIQTRLKWPSSQHAILQQD